MNVGFGIYSDAASEPLIEDILQLEERLRERFRGADHGGGIGNLYLGVVCYHEPHRVPARRLRFTEHIGGKNSITGEPLDLHDVVELDVLLRPEALLALEGAERSALLRETLCSGVEQLRDHVSFYPHFWLDRFLDDFRACLEEPSD